MSAMERLKVWLKPLNQQIANVLGDLQEREPIEDPSPARAVCRFLFIVSLLVGFALLLVYALINAPDVRVVEIYHLTPEGKNQEFLNCIFYDRNLSDCKKWDSKYPEGISVSCPCTNTRAAWKDFVRFHKLHANSPDRKVSFHGVETQHNEKLPTETLPPASYHEVPYPDVNTKSPGNVSIVEDKEDLSPEEFCDLSCLEPPATPSISPGQACHEKKKQKVANIEFLHKLCVWMATLLFNGSNEEYENKEYEDQTRSTKFLNTPSLLYREELNTQLAKLAGESVLRRRLALDMTVSLDAGNENFRRFFNALAHQLTELLDRDEMNKSQSYAYGAQEFSDTLKSKQYYDKKAMVWHLLDDSGPIFLHPEIDWNAYRSACSPKHCEVIKPMRGARKLYWALGIVGGVSTIALAVVKTLLWPCTAMLLQWISEYIAATLVMLLLWISEIARIWGPGTPQVAGPQSGVN